MNATMQNINEAIIKSSYLKTVLSIVLSNNVATFKNSIAVLFIFTSASYVLITIYHIWYDLKDMISYHIRKLFDSQYSDLKM